MFYHTDFTVNKIQNLGSYQMIIIIHTEKQMIP